ncbi:MAG: putative baseplate assembly protein [Leptolyngbyaceae cyanobacterium SL_7_1]|nr:putative baseplate assembly protein [Leptolyngbyaceae cyanobacterium SL_7_1]
MFEAIAAIKLHPACNTLRFYTWSDPTCTLAVGATSATLIDPTQQLLSCLHPGRVLLLEEVKDARTGEPADADPSHRHGVRLTKIEPTYDALEDLNLVTIEWAQADALPFALTLSQLVDDRPVTDITVARGNVVLADHGYTIDGATAEEPQLDWIIPQSRARLRQEPLTQQGRVRLQNPTNSLLAQTFGENWRQRWGNRPPFDPEDSATAALYWELTDVVPAIGLTEHDPSTQKTNTWYPQRDLLNSDRTAREFVVETEDDGRAYLRFGDGQLGRAPQADATLTPTYRVGNGTAGNIGADAIAHIFLPETLGLELEDRDRPIRNPIAAQGGINPEPIEQVRLYAPQAFRTLQRAVTEADYGEIVQRFPGVSKALATRQWTGSWYTIFITVDRQGGLAVDPAFQRSIEQFLEPYRLAGQDVKIESPRFVPLDVALRVAVAPEYFQTQVKQALLEGLSDRVLDAGRLGFFHPDNFTFGQPVYLSQVVASVMQVAGVRSVSPVRFQRWGVPSAGELDAGQIGFERLEIARLNRDQPGQGQLELFMEGGV